MVRTESRIEAPRSARRGEPSWIAGVAWAGIRGIAAVEVSLDGGHRWRPARLHRPLSPWAWTPWALRWVPRRSGRQAVLCRAVDAAGTVQDSRRAEPPLPSGASGYHRIEIPIARSSIAVHTPPARGLRT
ncbi:MAG: hypothetical protein AB7V58_00435 [Solirubrobacterales bacterium]